MTKDARVTVRAYITSMSATSVFRADKNRYRGQNRVFSGSVTITKATKEFILEHKPESFRELFVIAELSLCSLLCFAGIPHNDAKGWIVDDIEQDEFKELKDIQQIQSYLTKNALIWKKPIHVTEYKEFQGKKPKDLESKLRNRDLALLCDEIKRNDKKSKRNNNMNRNNANSKRIKINEMVHRSDDSKDEDENEDDDLVILKDNNKENKNKSNKRTLYSYWNELDIESRPNKKRRIN